MVGTFGANSTGPVTMPSKIRSPLDVLEVVENLQITPEVP